MKHHLKHMAIGGGLILAVLLALRVDLRTALTYALLLAFPMGTVGLRPRRDLPRAHLHRIFAIGDVLASHARRNLVSAPLLRR